MLRLFLRANLQSQGVLTKMAWERCTSALPPPPPLPWSQLILLLVLSYIEWLWKYAVQLAPPALPPPRCGLCFSVIIAAMGLASGSGVYLRNLFLCFQFHTVNFLSTVAWIGVACCGLADNGGLRVVGEGRGDVLLLLQPRRWQPVSSRALAPFCPS